MQIIRNGLTAAIAAGCLGLAAWTAQAGFDPEKVDVEPPEVAARFAEPDVAYDTPAFAPGKEDFTSHAEMMAYVRELQARAPDMQVRILGRSHEGREIPLLVFAGGASSDPASLLREGRPTVLVIALQHGNEPASGEAALVLAKRLAEGDLARLLDRINVVVVPRANPDAAEAFVRDTALGIDQNRDHLLLNTPEGRALALVAREYLPAVVMDTHEFTVMARWVEKFGAVQRYDALVQYATVANLPEPITRAAEEWFRQPLMDDLEAEDLSAFWYFTTSPTNMEDRRISMGGVQPNTGRNVTGLRNAVSFLLEVRGVGLGRAHLERRVRTTEIAVASLLHRAHAHADELRDLVREAADEVRRAACGGELVVSGAQTPERRTVTFLDARTGEDMEIEVDWNSALAIRPEQVRSRPCGYAFDGSQTLAAERLRELGVTVHTLAQGAVLEVEEYVVEEMDEGRRQDVRGTIADPDSIVKYTVRTEPGSREVPAGTFYVSLAQPLGNLVAAAMEPDAENGYPANRLLSLDEGVGLLRVTAQPGAPLFVEDAVAAR